MSTHPSPREPAYRTDIGIADFHGVSEMMFEAEAQTPATVDTLVAIVETFERAARAGMFSPNPAPTTVPIEIVAADTSGLRVRRVWRMNGVHVGGYRVLLNMLDAMHRFDAPLGSVTLRSSVVDERRLAWRDLMAYRFPDKSAQLPFEWRVGRDLVDSAEPLIRIQFDRDITDDALRAITPLFVTWDGLVIRGGYVDDPVDLADTDIAESLAGQQTYLASPDTVEHLFYEEIGPEAAYYALVNMALKLHLTFCAVRSFEIE
jgi:hypothetical protein